MKGRKGVTVTMTVSLPDSDGIEARYRTLLASLHNGQMWWARIQNMTVTPKEDES